jgi:hypothetical protein
MAVIPFTPTKNPPEGQFDGVLSGHWDGLNETDTDGAPIAIPALADRTVQVVGDFGGAASVAIHGSLDGVNYVALSDLAGDTIAITSAGIAVVQENVAYIKPVVTGGTSVDLDVFILARDP